VSDSFRALVVSESQGTTSAELRQLTDEELPDGDVTVAVEFSSLNYKDGLALTGRGRVVRRFPMVPGVDLAGQVLQSDSDEFARGDRVLATGCGLGERHFGGYAGRARLPAEWLVAIPDVLTTKRAMAIGTAGFTAMLSLMALEEHSVQPSDGQPIVVTGAGGGVGSVAVALLAGRGYPVAAATGREKLADDLRALGAREIVPRAVLEAPARPLESQRWAGAVDTVGGAILARVLAETAVHGSVAACGLAASGDLVTTVMPFILRGVNLLGIDSNTCPRERRLRAWQRLAAELPGETIDRLTTTIALEDVARVAEDVLAGRVHGRTVVALAS